MATYQHGVYNQEQATSLTTPIRSSAGLQVIFGTAPVHLAKDPAKAANTPKLCYSFAECQAAVGYSDDFQKFTLCQSIDANFRVFNNAPIILVNVLDPENSKHTQDNNEESCTVANEQAVYAKPYVLLDTLVVKKDSTPLVAETDYTAAHDGDGNVLITLISENRQGGGEPDGVLQEPEPRGRDQGGYCGRCGYRHGQGKRAWSWCDRSTQSWDWCPACCWLPDGPTIQWWRQRIQAKTGKINGNFDCNAYLDIAANSTGATVYTAVKTAKEKLGASSNHAAAFWPKVAVGEKIYCMSAMAAAENGGHRRGPTGMCLMKAHPTRI